MRPDLARGYTLSLKDFMIEDKPNRVIGVGVGSAGCRITSRISRFKTGIDRFYYISLDENDLRGVPSQEAIHLPPQSIIKSEPSVARGAGLKHHSKIRSILKGVDVSIIIAGLGGAVGSGLAPLVAEIAREEGAFTLALVVMPARYEHSRLFYSAVALRQLKTICDNVVVVDNDDLSRRFGDEPILDLYDEVNERLAFALSRLLGALDGRDYALGLGKLIASTARERYTLLAMSDRKGMLEAVSEAATAIYGKASPSEAESALLYLSGPNDLSASLVEDSIKHLTSLFGCTLKVEYGFSANGYTKVTAVVLASGFKSTRLIGYDPLDGILDLKIDCAPECSVELPLDSLTQLE